ncbi:MAG: preprotein translocase subunit SecG [Clostridia bacterium]|nr:preprotein translocase subunit SecG [Clostridia bacterium]
MLLANLLEKTYKSTTYETVHMTLLISLIILMAIAAIALIVLVLLQPSNSSGIDALGGSSETFFGKHKGKSIEAKMKKWTWIILAILAVFAIAFFIIKDLKIFFN